MGVDTVDYEKLIQPYSEPSEGATRASVRTASGQRMWLLQRGFPGEVIDEAMRIVYGEIAMGRVFTRKGGDPRPAGYWLDRHLLDTCRTLMQQSHAGAVPVPSQQQFDAIAAFARESIRNAWIKGVLLGALFGGAVSGALTWLLIH